MTQPSPDIQPGGQRPEDFQAMPDQDVTDQSGEPTTVQPTGDDRDGYHIIPSYELAGHVEVLNHVYEGSPLNRMAGVEVFPTARDWDVANVPFFIPEVDGDKVFHSVRDWGAVLYFADTGRLYFTEETADLRDDTYQSLEEHDEATAGKSPDAQDMREIRAARMMTLYFYNEDQLISAEDLIDLYGLPPKLKERETEHVLEAMKLAVFESMIHAEAGFQEITVDYLVRYLDFMMMVDIASFMARATFVERRREIHEAIQAGADLEMPPQQSDEVWAYFNDANAYFPYVLPSEFMSHSWRWVVGTTEGLKLAELANEDEGDGEAAPAETDSLVTEIEEDEPAPEEVEDEKVKRLVTVDQDGNVRYTASHIFELHGIKQDESSYLEASAIKAYLAGDLGISYRGLIAYGAAYADLHMRARSFGHSLIGYNSQ